MLKNVATGRCMKGGKNSQTSSIRMVKCNRNDAAQWWAPAGGKIVLPSAGALANDVCLAVHKGNLPVIPVSTACGRSGYNTKSQFAVGSAYPISPAGPPYGYYQDYSSYIYAEVYKRAGKHTEWNWVS